MDNSYIYQSRLGHIKTYSGIFNPSNNYKKFDFVYNTGDGLYYYAKEDLISGGSTSVSDSNRFALVDAQGFPSPFIVDTFNASHTLNEGNVIKIEGSNSNSDGLYSISKIRVDIVDEHPYVRDKRLNLGLTNEVTGTLIEVSPVSDNFSIKDTEFPSNDEIKISTMPVDPSVDEALWVKDEFFFDPDYGTTVNFQANNFRNMFGNGYFQVRPKGINSLGMTVDMQFKNRSNREANSIVHFVENHLGQLEKDRPSPNLLYKQGVSGFRWGGDSCFHPYDHIENQSKTFYCTDISHTLSFENSNDISLKLRSLEDSMLRKTVQGGWIIGGGEAYDNTSEYEKNDFVLYTGNMQYYYWSGENPVVNKPPAEKNPEWTRERGYFSDLDVDYELYVDSHQDLLGHFQANPTVNGISYPLKKDWGRAHYRIYGQFENRNVVRYHWTRKFFWKPSLGLTVSQNPRMSNIAFKNGYTQLYSDGINENLLTLDLNFKNRDDKEARAILHFLEQKLGYIPFEFSPPAPYDKIKNFICEKWSHTYNFKDNHDISASFVQFPFNLSASDYEDLITPSKKSDGMLVFTSPVCLSRDIVEEALDPGEKIKARLRIENIGEKPVTLSGAVAGGDRIAEGFPNYDYEAYVDSHPDLSSHFSKNPEVEGVSYPEKKDWGRAHYEIFGKFEGRVINFKTNPAEHYPMGAFTILGQQGNNCPAVLDDTPANDYIVKIPNTFPLYPFSLNNKWVKINKNYEDGPRGGQFFYTMINLNSDPNDDSGPFVHETKSFRNLSVNVVYFQNNLGYIKEVTQGHEKNLQYSEAFVVENLFKTKFTSSIDGRKTAYIDIVFQSPGEIDGEAFGIEL